MISLLDLTIVNKRYEAELADAVLRVSQSGRYVLGPEVETFEARWASFVGAKRCVGTANALEAMQLALTALGVGPGDEVIVPANTYIATWLAVTHAGATPVPVEPSYTTLQLDPLRVEERLTKRTRAILPVHLYGHPAPMEELMRLAETHGLWVVEDAAQAHGAECYFFSQQRPRRVGSIGDATCWSFYPSKNLGALGDAGAMTTNWEALATKTARLRNYGGVGRLDHTVIGINSRLDEMQAAILKAKLPFLGEENHRRIARARKYRTLLRDLPLVLPPDTPGSVYHQFVVRSPHRDKIVERAFALGLDLHVHYPVPPHLEGAYRDFGFRRGSFPIAEQLASEVFSLPIGYEVDQDEVCRILRQATQEAT